jgi:hypothetical protein
LAKFSELNVSWMLLNSIVSHQKNIGVAVCPDALGVQIRSEEAAFIGGVALLPQATHMTPLVVVAEQAAVRACWPETEVTA